MKKSIIKVIIILLIGIGYINASLVHVYALTPTPCTSVLCGAQAVGAALNPTATPGPGQVTINTPIPGDANSIFSSITNKVTLLVLFAIGVIFIGLMIFAGFLFMSDAGNEENVKKAKGVLTSAVIGIAVIALTGFLIKAIEAILGVYLGV